MASLQVYGPTEWYARFAHLTKLGIFVEIPGQEICIVSFRILDIPELLDECWQVEVMPNGQWFPALFHPETRRLTINADKSHFLMM